MAKVRARCSRSKTWSGAAHQSVPENGPAGKGFAFAAGTVFVKF
jgi:hypothetical protein